MQTNQSAVSLISFDRWLVGCSCCLQAPPTLQGRHECDVFVHIRL